MARKWSEALVLIFCVVVTKNSTYLQQFFLPSRSIQVSSNSKPASPSNLRLHYVYPLKKQLSWYSVFQVMLLINILWYIYRFVLNCCWTLWTPCTSNVFMPWICNLCDHKKQFSYIRWLKLLGQFSIVFSKCIVHLVELMKYKSTIDFWECTDISNNHSCFRNDFSLLEAASLSYNTIL